MSLSKKATLTALITIVLLAIAALVAEDLCGAKFPWLHSVADASLMVLSLLVVGGNFWFVFWVVGKIGAEEGRRRRSELLQKKILRCLRETTSPMNSAQIASEIRASEEAIRSELRQLEHAQNVAPDGKGGYRPS